MGLLAILCLPPVLMAQDQKDVEIKIENGDTTVNGKNIKDQTPAERKEAMRDIRHLSGDEFMNNAESNRHMFMFRRRDTLMDDGHGPEMANIIIRKNGNGDSIMVHRSGRMKMMNGGPSFAGRTGRGPMREPMMGPGMRNSQSMTYVTTNRDGISTRIMFRISDVTNDDLKRMPHVEGARLDINDLNLVPQFSTGKTMLVFTLPEKTAAQVKLIDSEGKVMWTEKTSGGTFAKSFVMGLNGVYYLQIQQGKGVTVKRILKEE